MEKDIKEMLRHEELTSDAANCVQPGFIHHVGESYWGNSFYVMDERGIAMVCVKCYNEDEPDTAFIESLSVSFKFRELGYGSMLMDMAENVCRALGRRYAVLGVTCGSWQESWYRRRGFSDCEFVHSDENLIILKKDLFAK